MIIANDTKIVTVAEIKEGTTCMYDNKLFMTTGMLDGKGMTFVNLLDGSVEHLSYETEVALTPIDIIIKGGYYEGEHWN